MADVLIIGIGVFFCGMGLVALARPAFVVALFGTPTFTRDGRSEVRAVYGGFGLAIGGVLFAAAHTPSLRPGVLLAVAAALGGMAAGRVLSVLVDGPPGRWPALFFVVEVLLMAALLAAW